MPRLALLAFLFRPILLSALAALAPAQFLRHVDRAIATSGDGQTWATAFKTIEEALDDARGLGDYEVWIWVKEGTYGRGSDSWAVADNVSLYGGFAGTETLLAARNVALHPTVLDGTARELPWGIVDAFRPLLIVDDHAVLDGLTIRNCCTLCGGSALQLSNSDLTIDVAAVTGCTFEDNWSLAGGGAIWAGAITNLHCTDCRFARNSTSGNGGAIRADHDITLQRCEFRGNRAANGGAVSKDGAGPALYVYNCMFSGNVATYEGGGIRAEDCQTVIAGSTLHGNQAYYGGGIAHGSTWYGVQLRSCILWENRNEVGLHGYDQQLHAAWVSPMLQYCCIEGWTSAKGGTACTAGNPMFWNANGPDGIAGTGDENLRLRPSSPCIDKGAWVSGLGTLDCGRANRTVAAGGLVPRMDIGAYEVQ